METWDAITSRRNVRSFADRPLAEDDLDRILEAGRRAPSSRNTQPWDFVVVTDREQLGELAKVWRGAGHVARSAAAIALVLPPIDDPPRRGGGPYDLRPAAMGVMIAAPDPRGGARHAAPGAQGQAPPGPRPPAG